MQDKGYPFRDVAPKIYPTTFLKDVSLSVSYLNVPDGKASETQREFLKQKFELKELKTDDQGNIGIVSDDRTISFIFGANLTCIKIKYPRYSSFKQILEWVPLMTQYLQLNKYSGEAFISISKFNELQYELNSDANADVSEVMNQVFSDDLLKYPDGKTKLNAEMFQDLSRWEKLNRLYDAETRSLMKIVYGFSKDEHEQGNSKKKGSLTLKSEIFFNTDNIQDTPFKDSILTKYNHILDNAFHWCVKPVIISAMEQTNE